MSVRVWVGPAMKPGAVYLGDDVLRNPVMADEDGVVAMTPLKGVSNFRVTYAEPETAP